MMKIVVIGAGNMGCVYGGNLARIGQAVGFIDIWPEHVRSIQESGLRMEGLSGSFTVQVKASTGTTGLTDADVVLICVNSYTTAAAARMAQAVLKSTGFCVTLQNGVGNVEILEAELGRERVLAGLSFQSGDLAGPGFVRHTNNGPTYLGELDGKRTERLVLLESLLTTADLNPVLVDDIVATIWAKFVHNCGINAICAITGLRPGHIREVPELDEFQSRIVAEAVALMQAKEIALPDANPSAAIKEYCSHKFHRPSMMQHLDRGQQTEIDSLNGYVARESSRLGLQAPFNTALTMLIKGREYHPGTPHER
jgi:2-dehydropantoate 2-reductase